MDFKMTVKHEIHDTYIKNLGYTCTQETGIYKNTCNMKKKMSEPPHMRCQLLVSSLSCVIRNRAKNKKQTKAPSLTNSNIEHQ